MESDPPDKSAPQTARRDELLSGHGPDSSPSKASLTAVRRTGFASGTASLFAICVVVFLLQHRSGRTDHVQLALDWGASERNAVWQGDWWRLFTSVFLHANYFHLLVNLVVGWWLCSPVEKRFGTWRFVGLYIASGITASSLAILGSDAVVVGASGAISGVVGAGLAAVRLDLGSWRLVAERRPLIIGVAVVAVFLTAYQLVMGGLSAHLSWAHEAGFGAGMVLAWAILTHFGRRSVVALCAVFLVIPLSLFPRGDRPTAEAVHRDAEAARDQQQWDEVLRVLAEFERSAQYEEEELWAGGLRLKAFSFLGASDAGVEWAAGRVANNPTSASYTVFGSALLWAGDTDAGVRQLDHALALEPAQFSALDLRSRTRLETGDFVGGLEDARDMVLAFPDEAASHLVFAMALAANGKADSAEAEFERGVGLKPEAENLAMAREYLDSFASLDGGAR